jgi:hypothetical protein
VSEPFVQIDIYLPCEFDINSLFLTQPAFEEFTPMNETFCLDQGVATITVETLYDAKAHFSR